MALMAFVILRAAASRLGRFFLKRGSTFTWSKVVRSGPRTRFHLHLSKLPRNLTVKLFRDKVTGPSFIVTKSCH